jgi:hypothetical protein
LTSLNKVAILWGVFCIHLKGEKHMNQQVTVKTVSLYPLQWERIEQEARKQGISRSHVVRRLVDGLPPLTVNVNSEEKEKQP